MRLLRRRLYSRVSVRRAGGGKEVRLERDIFGARNTVPLGTKRMLLREWLIQDS